MNISKPKLVKLAKEFRVKNPTTLNKAQLLKALNIDLPPPTDSRVIRCTNLKLASNPCPITFVSGSGDQRAFPSMAKAIKTMRFSARTIVRMRDAGIVHKGWRIPN